MQQGLNSSRACQILAVMALAFSLRAAFAAAQNQGQGQAPQGSSSTGAQAPNSIKSGVEVLTPTNGVDFSGYISKLLATLKKNWIAAMPFEFYAGAKGKTTLEFRIESDGTIENITLKMSSGADSLDQAAIKGVRDSSPLEHLPPNFKGPYIYLRLSLFYNLTENEAAIGSAFDCKAQASDAPQAPPFDRLELLAILTSGGYLPYEAKAICQRGVNFLLDPAFLTTLRDHGVAPAFADSLTKLKPEEIVQAPPDRVSAYGLLDVALTDKRHGEIQKADDELARAVKLAPDSAALRLAYARNLLTAHDSSGAEVQSRRALELWPDYAEARLTLAMALSLQNRDSEAVPEAREALRIAPGNKSARAELGISLARSGQYQEAIPLLRDAKSMAPQLPSIYKLLGGSLVHAGGDFDEAIRYLNLFLKTKPDDAETHYLLGVALRGMYKPDEALAEFREAARLAPGNSLYASSAALKDSNEPAPGASKPDGLKPDDGFIAENLYTNTFFGFSYQFPKGWNVLKAEQGKAMVRLGTSFFANGDPTAQDLAEAAAASYHQLLFVSKQTTKDISTSNNLIQVQAASTQFAPQFKTGGDLLKSTVSLMQLKAKVNSHVEPPEQFVIGDRTFWKVTLDLPINNVVVHEMEAVTIEKGYFILFVFASPDATTLNEIAGTMNSLRFTLPPQ